jgi:hypothetical protein
MKRQSSDDMNSTMPTTMPTTIKTTEVELVALTPRDTYTLGRGRTYSEAVMDARRRALNPHSVCAMVLAWPAPLIRAYSRPQHAYGVIVPCEAITAPLPLQPAASGRRAPSLASQLKARGVVLRTRLDVMRAWEDGARVFGFHEQDAAPAEICCMATLEAFTPDQLLALYP